MATADDHIFALRQRQTATGLPVRAEFDQLVVFGYRDRKNNPDCRASSLTVTRACIYKEGVDQIGQEPDKSEVQTTWADDDVFVHHCGPAASWSGPRHVVSRQVSPQRFYACLATVARDYLTCPKTRSAIGQNRILATTLSSKRSQPSVPGRGDRRPH